MIAKFGTFEYALAERYRFEDELGRGAMGIVYRATDVRLGRPVAIKLLHPALTNELGVARFESEIRIAAGLHHPNIVGVHDSGESDGRLFYVMDYLGGETLRARLEREKQLAVDDALSIVEQVAAGLQYAHDHGIVHRDVKPENILVVEGRACIMDFGLARALSGADAQRLTASGLAVGTPHYLSPEQASAEKEVGPKADQYALACVLYEMLAGEPPFTGPTASSIAMRHITQKPTPLRNSRAKTPVKIDDAVLRALEKVPADRFASVSDFAHALGHGAAVLSGTPEASRKGWRSWLPLPMAAAVALSAGVWWSVGMPKGEAALSLKRLIGHSGLDLNRVAVFPLVAPQEVQIRAGTEHELRDALSRWKELDVVTEQETAASVAPDSGHALTGIVAVQLARELSAGRFVVGGVIPVGDRVRVHLEMHNTGEQTATSATAEIRPGESTDSIVSHLVFLLMFGGHAAELQWEADSRATRSVQAFTALVEGRESAKVWSLVKADSLFSHALQLDPEFAPAALALAQTRTWMSDAPLEVDALLARAVAAPARMTVRELAQAKGLQALVNEQYEHACRSFAQLTKDDESDFAPWFGYAECNRRDSVVVRNAASPSGRSFRGSAHTAFAAMARGFRLMIDVDSCCVVRAYQLQRRPLITSTSYKRRGQGLLPDKTRYSAYPELSGDTIAFVPYPAASDLLRAPPRTHTLAIDQQRRTFYTLAVQRVQRTPNRSEALEELAEAMELRGEQGVIDTLRRARGVAKSSSQALRLAETEVWWQLKHNLPGNPAGLVAARQLAESLVAHVRPVSPGDASRLTSLSVLIGDANTASRLAQQSAEALPQLGASAVVMTQGYSFLALASIGGPSDSLREHERKSADAINNDVVQERQAAVREMLLGRAVSIAYPSYRTASLTSLDSSDYLLRAEAAHARGDAQTVRRILREVDRSRAGMRFSDITFDAVYPEAFLLAEVGDTVGALRRLGMALRAIDNVSSQVLSEWPNVGGLTRAVALYARLLHLTGSVDAARWEIAARAMQLKPPP